MIPRADARVVKPQSEGSRRSRASTPATTDQSPHRQPDKERGVPGPERGHPVVDGTDGQAAPRRWGSTQERPASGRRWPSKPFGDPRRGWDFVSPGRGGVPFEQVFRALNQVGYAGPLSIEWEDNNMNREQGAPEAVALVKRLDLTPAEASFEEAFKSK